MLKILFLKTKIYSPLFLMIFLSQIPAKYFTKFRLFQQKQHEISFFSPLRLNLQEVHTKNTTNTIFLDWKWG